VVAEDGAGLVVSGREIRATKQQRNKSLGWFSRVLSRCTKGSRRWKKLLRAKHRLKGKTNAQVQDLLHKATRKAINWCIKHQVAELVIGNPAGVEKDTKKQKRLSRKSRRRFRRWRPGGSNTTSDTRPESLVSHRVSSGNGALVATARSAAVRISRKGEPSGVPVAVSPPIGTARLVS